MYKEVTECRCCGCETLFEYLDLGDQPLANSYHYGEFDQREYPLKVNVCEACWHSQLSVVVEPEIMFKHYLYVSGTTHTFRKHCAELAFDAVDKFLKWQSLKPTVTKPRVLDIACFSEGNVLVDGFVPKDISDVKVGDKVLDKEGNFTKVTKTYKRFYKGDLYGVKIIGGRIVYVTPEHPIAVIKKPYKSFSKKGREEFLSDAKTEWVKACDLEVGDFCLLPIAEQKIENFYVKISDFSNCIVENGLAYSKQSYKGIRVEKARNCKPVVNKVSLDNEFGRLCGFYISEGSGRGSNSTVSFTFHKKEDYLYNQIVKTVKNIFGFESRISLKDNTATVTFNSVLLKQFMQNNFGAGAKNKKLPKWVFNATQDFIKGLCYGLFQGDGAYVKTKKSRTLKYDTISERLAYQVKHILLNCFFVPSSIVLNKPNGYGKHTGSTLYSVRVFDCGHLNLLNEFIQYEDEINLSSSRPNRRPLIAGNVLNRVSSIMKRNFDGYVYNLETSSQSYVIDSMSVHNCNDGTLLECFRAEGCKVQGVDPAENLRKLTEEKNIAVDVGYWENGMADKMKERYHIITATNVFAHVDDIGSFLDECLKVLAYKDGIIIIEFPYCEKMISQCEFDQIYHEHLSYFLVHSMMQAVGRKGLVIKDVLRTPIHGGSIRFFLQPGEEHCREAGALMALEARQKLMHKITYEKFGEKVEKTKDEMKSLVKGLQEDGKKVIGFGASAKGNTMLNYFELDLDYIVDDNEMKWGYLTPGRDIPIKSPEVMADEDELYIVILAWNFYDEIVEKIEQITGKKHHYIRYVPEVSCT